MRTLLLALALGGLALAAPARAAAQAPDPALIARGAQIYGAQCARCHNLRSPTEFNAVDWRTIMAQMRARANLTRDEGRAVLAFLEATDGQATATTAAAGAPAPKAAPQANPPDEQHQSQQQPLTTSQTRQLRRYLTQLEAAQR